MRTYLDPSIRRSLLALTLVASVASGCQAAASPTPTANPTNAVVQGGTITLTDTGCTWEGNPGSMAAGRVNLNVQNSTDDYGLFVLHRLHVGKSWAEGETLIAAIQEALKTGADWPPAVSDAITEAGAEAGAATRMTLNASPGTYGVVCSANTSSTGDILTVFLVGPLTVAP